MSLMSVREREKLILHWKEKAKNFQFESFSHEDSFEQYAEE